MPRRPVRPRSALRAEWAPLPGSSAGDRLHVTPRPLTLLSADGCPGSIEITAARAGDQLTIRSAAEAAHGAFRDALRDLGRPDGTAAGGEGAEEGSAGAATLATAFTHGVAPDRWADEGGPRGRLFVGAHRPSLADRDAWAARACAGERADDRVYAAAGAYARALRREGVGLPAALVAVRATVADDAARLSAAAYAAVQRAAARCCLEAFYAH